MDAPRINSFLIVRILLLSHRTGVQTSWKRKPAGVLPAQKRSGRTDGSHLDLACRVAWLRCRFGGPYGRGPSAMS